jgi:hypothetical protein
VPTGNIHPIETDEERAGVVLVTGRFFKHGSLNYLTSKIIEGPLFGVNISYDKGSAQIVFLRAKHALAFWDRNRELIGSGRPGCFGQGYTVTSVHVMDWTDEIRQMENRPKERRRLTFARAGLLGEKLKYKRFQDDLVAVAGGAEAMDLIWAFNAGNSKLGNSPASIPLEALRHQDPKLTSGYCSHRGIQRRQCCTMCPEALSDRSRQSGPI